MDDQRFDGLVKSVALHRLARRNLIRALVGGGLAAVLGAPDANAATCRRKDDACGNGRGPCCGDLRCCNGRCRNLRTDERFCGTCATACVAADQQVCRDGACICPDGRPDCGGQCCGPTCGCSSDKRCICPLD